MFIDSTQESRLDTKIKSSVSYSLSRLYSLCILMNLLTRTDVISVVHSECHSTIDVHFLHMRAMEHVLKLPLQHLS